MKRFFRFCSRSLPFAVIAVMASCDDNISPNSPQYSDLSPALTLSAAQTQTFRVITGDNRNFENSVRTESLNQLGSVWMNTWSGNVNNTTGGYNDEYTTNISSTFYGNIWNWTYTNVGNFQKIIDYNSDEFDRHKAIAKILKSFYMQYIVDLYGDCPYSEAFKGTDNLFPKYDDDKDVYRGLVTEIDEAIAMINSVDSNDATVGSEDAMLAGNMDKWKRFANTLKLRILMRQSSLTDAETVSYLDAQFNVLATADFLEADVTINPGYSNASADQQNPFYGAYGYGISGQTLSMRDYVVASKNVADKLNFISDPRRSRLFATSGTVIGIEQGETAATAPNNPSLIGPAFIPVPVSGNSSVGSSMDGYVFTLSEAKFILSEAALKYPTKFSTYDAQTLFNEGVQASFDRLGVSIGSYLSDIDLAPGYGWGGTSDKVEAIMTQKWIALMHTHAIESWIDYVRTGYPVTPLPLINTVGRTKRLMYPNSEYVANSANVPAQTASTVLTTGPFWLP